MGVAEIAPVIGDNDVLDIWIWQVASLIVIGAIVPADIDAVVIFGFLLLLPGFKRRNSMSLLKRMVAIVLARGVGVFIVAGERKEKHTTVFFLGLVSSYLFQRQTDSELLNALFQFCYAVLPNWQYFWLADAVAVNRPIPFSYVVDSLVYVVLYVSICSMWAVAIFQNKEIAGDGRV